MVAGSSVRAQPKPNAAATKSVKNWRPFSSKTGAFSVRMPGTPKSAIRGAGKNKLHAFFHAVPGGAYMVTYGDMREGDVIECYRVETIQRSL